MRVLFLPRYTRLGASSRIRAYQYFPHLAEHGVEIEVSPLVEDAYLDQLYAGQDKQWLKVAQAYGRRIRYLLNKQDKVDVLWIQKELLPNMPAWFEKILLHHDIPYVLDYDDATFLNYTQGHPLKQALLGQKIARLIRGATLVIAGNDYLADYAKKSGANWVEILPSVIDGHHYPQQAQFQNDVFTIGWVGTPTTTKYLQNIRDVLVEFCATHSAQIILVGAEQQDFGDLPIKYMDWSEATEAEIIASFDVGIMPLTDTDWERGKCGYKLLQYMACGVPTIARDVGANRTIVEHNHTGFLVNTSSEWLHAWQTLYHQAETRRTMGQAGYRKLLSTFELQVTAPQLHQLLQAVAKS